MHNILFDPTVPNFLLLLALTVWGVTNVQVRRDEGRWLLDTTDAIFLVLLACYARFA